jgi:hypothetical protein
MRRSGIIAMSLAAGQNFDERTNNLSQRMTSPSLILIWSFVDPIQPKVITVIDTLLLKDPRTRSSCTWKHRTISNASNFALPNRTSLLVAV